MKYFENAFRKLKLGGGNAPHQPCFLLAVIDAIEAGYIQNNEICYGPYLFERFERYFKVVDQLPKHFRPYYPFVYLGGTEFWNLHRENRTILNLSGEERNNLAISGFKKVSEVIAYASLDKELYASMMDDKARKRYREVLISRYFPELQDEMWTTIHNVGPSRQFDQEYNASMAEFYIHTESHRLERMTRNVIPRDPNFRVDVLRAYNYKCAATGWRLKTVNDGSLLEAAHIMPHSICVDNRPQNGMALIPTVHKAMDDFLIVPGPDLRWHASRFLREQAKSDEGAKWLLDLHHRPVELPEDDKLRPAFSVLEWRKVHLV